MCESVSVVGLGGGGVELHEHLNYVYATIYGRCV